MVTIRADHDLNDGLTVFVGEDRLVLDGEAAHQPHTRPSPVELLVASLAACMASSGGHFLRRAGLDGGLKVECDFDMSDAHPDHVARILFAVTVPPGIPTGRREALVRVLNHCAVHNPLHLAPIIDVAVREEQATARGAVRFAESARSS